MLLSGVALAGANAAGRASFQDGILYAIEAQNLNLDGTELVVLSACETGQGVIEKGEGVYGLVRALRTAGAKHAVVALRKIPDDETSQFMQKFYNNWLNNEDLSPVLALEITKRQFVQEGTSLNWASFIAISADGAD
jgi:CHAT domain-containing protein